LISPDHHNRFSSIRQATPHTGKRFAARRSLAERTAGADLRMTAPCGNMNNMAVDASFTLKRNEKLKEPEMYRVLLINDDYTTMDFVVNILELVFSKSQTEAREIMLLVHTKGRAVVGVYTEDIARTKASQVRVLASANQFPLACEVEPDA
jgi:ATP-dependent Clp protease adaptor protein ClpS